MPCIDINTVIQLYFECESKGRASVLHAVKCTISWVVQAVIRWSGDQAVLLQDLQDDIFSGNAQPVKMAKKAAHQSPVNGPVKP